MPVSVGTRRPLPSPPLPLSEAISMDTCPKHPGQRLTIATTKQPFKERDEEYVVVTIVRRCPVPGCTEDFAPLNFLEEKKGR
jgi:hypothetical protein